MLRVDRGRRSRCRRLAAAADGSVRSPQHPGGGLAGDGADGGKHDRRLLCAVRGHEVGGHAPIVGGYLSAVVAVSWTAAAFAGASAGRARARSFIICGPVLEASGLVLTAWTLNDRLARAGGGDVGSGRGRGWARLGASRQPDDRIRKGGGARPRGSVHLDLAFDCAGLCLRLRRNSRKSRRLCRSCARRRRRDAGRLLAFPGFSLLPAAAVARRLRAFRLVPVSEGEIRDSPCRAAELPRERGTVRLDISVFHVEDGRLSERQPRHRIFGARRGAGRVRLINAAAVAGGSWFPRATGRRNPRPSSDGIRAMPRQFLEDFAVGQVFGSGRMRIEGERIKSFAAEFDPQPFHLDESAAHRTRSSAGWRRAAGIRRR